MPRDARRTGRRTLAVVSILIGLGALLGANAGCGSAPKAESSPDAATEALKGTLGPSQVQLDCLKAKFQDDPSIAAVFNLTTKPSDDERAGYVRAIRVCIPVEDFARLLSTSARDAGTAPNEKAATCIHDTVVALPGDQQDQLYLYLSNPASVDADAVSGAAKHLLDACQLGDFTPQTMPNTTTDGQVTTVAPTAPTSASPGSG